MKNIITLLIFGFVFTNCTSQPENNNSTRKKDSTEIVNKEIKYEIDSSKWYIQQPDDLVKFMSELGREPSLNAEDIVALFTYNKFPVINYPSIMILNTQVSAEPPSLDQLERELGAMTMSIGDVEEQTKADLSEVIKDLDFKTPILIREKRLILMETTAQLPENQILNVRQSMYFRGRNIIAIQMSYIEGRDEKHLEDFNRIVETIKF